MIVSENEVYQIVKKSCVSEKIYEDWADDIGKAIAEDKRVDLVSFTVVVGKNLKFLLSPDKNGASSFKNFLYYNQAWHRRRPAYNARCRTGHFIFW